MPHSFAHQEGREGSFDPINAEENRLNKVCCLTPGHPAQLRVCASVCVSDDKVTQGPRDEGNTVAEGVESRGSPAQRQCGQVMQLKRSGVDCIHISVFN